MAGSSKGALFRGLFAHLRRLHSGSRRTGHGLLFLAPPPYRNRHVIHPSASPLQPASRVANAHGHLVCPRKHTAHPRPLPVLDAHEVAARTPSLPRWATDYLKPRVKG